MPEVYILGGIVGGLIVGFIVGFIVGAFFVDSYMQRKYGVHGS